MSLVLEFLFEVVFGAIFCWTGEIILFVLTFGKHKPRWYIFTDDSPSRFFIFSEISMWIGMVIWFVVLIAVIKFLVVK